MTFYVGQKVVCVNNAPLPGTRWVRPAEQPAVGAIYIVDGIGICDGYPIVFLAEIKRESGWGYGAERFRPIVERKTDISALTALLNPANHNEFVE